MKQFSVFLLCLMLNAGNIQSQTNKSLLWEISGNKLKSPSYLFGTIHITEDAVFNLPDSVLAKMLASDNVILELNLDSVMGLMLNRGMKKGMKKMSELLNAQELQKVKTTLKKNKIDVEKDPEEYTAIEMYEKYQKKMLKKGEQSTFLDAWLFGIGKSYGKNMIGLESYEEQEAILNDLSDADQREMLLSISDTSIDYQKYYDTLKILYLNEDLEGLLKYINLFESPELEERLFTIRNKNMTNRLDSIMRLQTCFTAVGAGHLPGKNGMIELLIKKGYTVTPLHSPRTGYYKQLLPESEKIEWKEVVDDIGGYKVLMPGAPSNMDMFGMQMKGLYDFGSGYFFLATGIPLTGNNSSAKEMQDAMIKNFEKKAKITRREKVTYKNFTGMDLYATINEKQNYIMRLVTDDSAAYILMIGVSGKMPDDKIANRFFDSLEKIKSTLPGMVLFRDDTGAFTMQVPANFKLNDSGNTEEARYKSYQAFDYNTLTVYSVTYADYKAGMYFDDLDKLFESAFEDAKKAMNADIKITDTVFAGFPSRHIDAVATDKSFLMINYFLRNNRFYIVMAGSKNTSKQEDIKSTFNSFRFIEPLPTPFKLFTDSLKTFSIEVPGEPTIIKDSTEVTEGFPSTDFYFSDPVTGNWILINKQKLESFAYEKSDSVYFEKQENLYAGYTDSVYDKKTFMENGNMYHSFSIMSENNTQLERSFRIIISGNNRYMLSTSLTKSDENKLLSKKYFDSFKILKADKTFNLFAPKTQKLIEALKSADSTVHQNAIKQLRNQKFEKEDIALFEAALKSTFSDDTLLGNNTRYEIYNKIFESTDSIILFDYIKSNYAKMPADGLTRLEAMGRLSEMNTNESLLLLKTYLLEKRPMVDESYRVYNCLRGVRFDSVPQAAVLFPEILELLKDSVYKSVVYSFASNMLGRGFVDPSVFNSCYDLMVSEAETEYEKYRNPPEGDDYFYSNTFYYNTYALQYLKESDRLTKLFTSVLTDTVYDEKQTAIVYLIKHKKPVDKKAYQKYLDNPYHRNSLYTELEKINRTDAYPSKLKNQKAFAEGDLYEVLEYDDYYVSKIKFIEERKAMYEGTLQRFYIYRVWFDEDNDAGYFALAGPYPVDGSKFYMSGNLTGYDIEDYDAKKLNAFFEKAITTAE